MRHSSSLLVASLVSLGLLASACTAKIATAEYEKRATDYAKDKVEEMLPDGITIQGLNDTKSSASNQKSAPVKKLGQTGAEGSGDGSGEGSAEGSGTDTLVGNAKPVTPILATPTVTTPPRPVTSWNAITFGGGNGLSCASAVIITGAKDRMLGTQSEYYWLSKVYPLLQREAVRRGALRRQEDPRPRDHDRGRRYGGDHLRHLELRPLRRSDEPGRARKVEPGEP